MTQRTARTYFLRALDIVTDYHSPNCLPTAQTMTKHTMIAIVHRIRSSGSSMLTKQPPPRDGWAEGPSNLRNDSIARTGNPAILEDPWHSRSSAVTLPQRIAVSKRAWRPGTFL